jgi:hypothetical protein
VAEFYLPLGLGLTDRQENQALELGEGSVNFYPDGEGYLVNYPGRTDVFVRMVDPPSTLGTPPATNVAITRIFVFRDYISQEHIVFVQGNTLREKVANGYKDLYTFIGQDYEGRYFPHLFVHEAKLIIVNFGDPVLVWDGVEKVNPLGVQETPMPLDIKCGPAPGVTYGGEWLEYHKWWPQSRPTSGPSSQLGADGTTRVHGIHDMVIQFQDKYGNKGRTSAPSRFNAKPKFVPAGYTESEEVMIYEYPVADYYPPLVEDHIAAVLVGRTLNLNPDGGAGSEGVYYRESIRDNLTYNRITVRMSDGSLAERDLIDTTCTGPTQASIGCSWRSRTFLAGHKDANIVSYSDFSFFGQYRPTNQYRANDHVKAVIPMGDRIAIITRTTTEVLYDSDAGLAVLEQDFANGSVYGRSFVDIGGAIFGLWNKGFGYYDGTKHTYVPAPYYIKSIYMDDRFFVHSAIKVNDWYIVSVRKDMGTQENNYLLMYHLRATQWYLLEETVYDLTAWGETFLGVDDSIYELFRGGFTAKSKLVLKGLVPEGAVPTSQRPLTKLRLLMEPSSKESYTVGVEGEHTLDIVSEAAAVAMPSAEEASRFDKLVPYWNKTNLKYADSPKWIAPRDVWLTPSLKEGVSAYAHTIYLTFAIGHLVRIKALAINFGEERSF